MINSIIKNSYFFLAAAIALAIWNGTTTAVEIKELILAVVITAVAALSLYTVLVKRHGIIHKDYFVWLVVLYIVSLVVAYLLTDRASLHYRAFIPQFFSIIGFMIVIHYFTVHDLHRLISIMLITGIIASLYGGIQFFGLDPLKWMQGENLLVLSFFGHKNYFGTFLFLTAPFMVYWTVSKKSRKHGIIGIIALTLSFFALIASNSRGALLCFVGNAVFFSGVLFLKFKKEKIFFNKKGFILGCAMVLTITVGMFLHSSKVQRYYGTLIATMNSGRMPVYKTTMEILQRHPLWGIGPGNFTNEHVENERHKYHVSGAGYILDNAHNDMLHLWTEYGIIPLLLYCGILAVFYIRMVRFLGRSDTRESIILAVAVLCSVTTYVAYSIVNVTFNITSSVFYFWMILGIGYLSSTERKTVSCQCTVFKRTVPTGILALLLFFITSILFIEYHSFFKAGYFVQQSIQQVGMGNPLPALRSTAKATEIQPKSIEAWYQHGYILYTLGKYDEALKSYGSVEKLAPNYLDLSRNIALCHYKKQDWQSTLRYSLRYVKLYPRSESGLMLLAYCYYYTYRPAQSYEYVKKTISINPKNQKALRLKGELEKLLPKEETDG